MLIIGYGNRDRGDDRAGVMVAECVRETGVPAEICTGDSLALIEAWSRADDVVIVDAVVTGAPIGKLWVWNAKSVAIPSSASTTTHGFGLAEAIELARILDRLPNRLRVFGIEGRRFDVGGHISPEVVHTVEQVAQRIVTEACASSP